MPRFVILEHNHPELHWDFLLENGNELLSWKLSQAPDDLLLNRAPQTLINLKAKLSAPHRLIYLDYEGPISNERGFVRRFDFGTFVWLQQNDKEVLIDLQGQKFTGPVKLSITQ